MPVLRRRPITFRTRTSICVSHAEIAACRTGSGNNISGVLPGTLNNLGSLTSLDLNTNALSQFIPYLAGMRKLVYLDLSFNQARPSLTA